MANEDQSEIDADQYDGKSPSKRVVIEKSDDDE